MISKRVAAFLIISMIFASGSTFAKKPNPANKNTSEKKVIVLALDGGGIKGVIPAMFLQQIEASLGKQSYQLFDVIGGTSTGGIISAALTSTTQEGKLPRTAEQIVQIYKNNGGDIFAPEKCLVEMCATYTVDDGKGKGIEVFLQKTFGKSTSLYESSVHIRLLPDSRVRQMFTTTYIVNSKGGVVASPVRGEDYGPYLFNWYDAVQDKTKHNYMVWEAARGTSAAPTFFPLAHVGGGEGWRSPTPEKWVIDGGTMSNDPAVWGVTEALRTGLAKDLKDIIIISLGTGIYPGGAGVGIHNNATDDTPKDGNWSTVPWVVEKLYDLEGQDHARGALLSVVLSAVQMVSDNQLKALKKAGLQYYRLEPELTIKQDQMDDISPENINALIANAKNYLESKTGKKTFEDIVAAIRNN